MSKSARSSSRQFLQYTNALRSTLQQTCRLGVAKTGGRVLAVGLLAASLAAASLAAPGQVRAAVDEPPTLTVDAAVDCEESHVSELLLLAGLVDAEDVAVDCEENGDAVVAVFSADDPEQRAVTYSLEGDDSDRFSISDGGSLRFRSPPDYEAPADSDGHNDYQVTVRASDGPNSVTRDVVVTVTDVNEPPTLSGDTFVSILENRFLLSFYRADDPEGHTVAYSLDGVDAGDFQVSERGLLMFRGGFVDYEDPKDSNRDNEYRVQVHVSDRRDADGNADDAIDDTVEVTVRVFDMNEHPRLLSGPEAVDYEEDDTGAVASYVAADPEQVELAWSLEGADRGVFAISGSGEVSFDSSVGSPDFEDPADSGSDNRYKLRVVASDGRHTVGRDLTVTVTNADEEGSVTLSSRQPQAGTALRASVADPDRSVSEVSWQWEASPDPSDPNSWSGTGGTGAAHTPDAGDVGDYLRVTATYRDAEGSGKSASAPAPEAVRAAPVTPNNAPAFPPTEDGMRSVDENTGVGVGVGDAVSALDDDTDDVLTYSLGGADGGSFEMDDATGQLRTKAPLDHERRPSHTVAVTVTDASGASATTAVTITVSDVDERPALRGPDAVNHKENDGAVTSYEAKDSEGETIIWSLAGDDAAAFTIDGGRLRFRSRPNFEAPHDADSDNEYLVLVSASDGGPDSEASEIEVAVNVVDVDEGLVVTGDRSVSHPENTFPVGDYSAVDPEGAKVVWSLAASYYDDEWFTVTGDGMLSFKSAPDYEDPADGDGDNVYYVWLLARGGDNLAQRRVAVTVTDEDDPGTVMLSLEQPRVGTELTAALNDPDRRVADKSWLWEASSDPSDPNSWSGTGATGAAYTPDAGDLGRYLRVTVTYTDRHGPGKIARAEARRPVAEAADLGPGPDPDPDPDPEPGGDPVPGPGPGGGSGPSPGPGGDPGPGLSGDGDAGPVSAGFVDVDPGGVHARAIEALFAAEITVGCTQEPLRFCPGAAVTRAQMATFLTRALDLPAAPQPAGFVDVDPGGVHSAAIEALFAAGITVGCTQEPLRFCPGAAVTRAQMATFLTRALDLLATPQPAGFVDVDPGGVHSAAIEALFAAGITVGCSQEPLRFCPGAAVTRAQMATFLTRALDL